MILSGILASGVELVSGIERMRWRVGEQEVETGEPKMTLSRFSMDGSTSTRIESLISHSARLLTRRRMLSLVVVPYSDPNVPRETQRDHWVCEGQRVKRRTEALASLLACERSMRDLPCSSGVLGRRLAESERTKEEKLAFQTFQRTRRTTKQSPRYTFGRLYAVLKVWESTVYPPLDEGTRLRGRQLSRHWTESCEAAQSNQLDSPVQYRTDVEAYGPISPHDLSVQIGDSTERALATIWLLRNSSET